VGLAMVRELGPVLAAVFIAGRVGSAIAAEIGSMKVTDQIDAMYSLSTSPIQYLVVPRFLALIIMIPLVTVFADLVGILGGGVISYFKLELPLKTYLFALQKSVHFGDIMSGIIKSAFFGGIIALVGCQQGLKTTGGAEGVGVSVTKSVVIASIAILISDYFLTLFLNSLLGI
jgi:phospholipid/cholesterol/gamma-HCH transport system permease protein